MNPKAWTLFIVALSPSCGVPNSFKKISYTSCALSQQSAQKICTIGAQKNKLFPRQGQVADTPDITRFRFNYSIRMPTGEIAAETSCDVDTAHYSILDARLLRLPASNGALDYLHQQELCSRWESVNR